MNLLVSLTLLHQLLYYNGLLRYYVIMYLIVCNYVSLFVITYVSHALHQLLVCPIYQQTQLEKLKLLVCCDDGAMLEVLAPQKDVYDTSKTYFLEPLKFTCRHFSSVKDKIKVIR